MQSLDRAGKLTIGLSLNFGPVGQRKSYLKKLFASRLVRALLDLGSVAYPCVLAPHVLAFRDRICIYARSEPKVPKGSSSKYIRLVEAYWENGRSKQRIIANLGRKDLLAPHLESLIELLSGGKRTKGSSA